MKIPVKLIKDFDYELTKRFAPVISDNQEVTCYLDEEMTPYSVQGDNILVIPDFEGGSSGYSIVHDVHTLTAEEAVTESFTLAKTIATGQEDNISLSVCGVAQILGVDFSVADNSITWSDKSLHNVGLTVGDVFIINYLTE